LPLRNVAKINRAPAIWDSAWSANDDADRGSQFNSRGFTLFEKCRESFVRLGTGAEVGDQLRNFGHERFVNRPTGDIARRLLGDRSRPWCCGFQRVQEPGNPPVQLFGSYDLVQQSDAL
jgi:hypothetical protein